MAYFANGSEGMNYEAHYCARCVHGDGAGAGTCIVWGLHFEYNYRDCNDEDSMLHELIPRSADHLRNEQCRMFMERRAEGKS